MISEIRIAVSFLKHTLVTPQSSIVEGDYNTTKLIFDIEEDVSDKRIVFKMSNPAGEVICLKDLKNNEVTLAGVDENGYTCSLFPTYGLYSFELVYYGDSKKLTSAPGWLTVSQSKVVITDSTVGNRIPWFDQLVANPTIHIRYSSYKDGTNFTETFNEDTAYVGFASGPVAPVEKNSYSWMAIDRTALNKRLTNLEQGYSEDFFKTDSTKAYTKTVPEDALPYAEVESVDDSVTAIKSFGGNKVLSKDAVFTSRFQSMTVTNLGGNKFQFDGYTSWQDSDMNWETGEYNKHTFLSFPLKAGTYKFSTNTTTGNTDDMGGDVNFALTVNGNSYAVGYVTITEDATAYLGVSAHSGGEGQKGYIGSFELFEVEGYKNMIESHSEFIPEPCNTLTVTDLGNGNFQFDGYTGNQEWMPRTFLKMPLKAGTYSLNKSVIVAGNERDETIDASFIIKVNGIETSFHSGSIVVTEETTAELIVQLGTGVGVGAEGMVVNISVVNNSAITRGVIDTLIAPLEEDNFIAVEPGGSLVFENEGNKAVSSRIIYMLKGV